MARKYAALRERKLSHVNVCVSAADAASGNNGLYMRPGYLPLPEWSAERILECLFYHNTDPELQSWLRLYELQDWMRCIMEHGAIEIHEETGKIRPAKDSIASATKLMEQYYKINGRDVTKMLGYSGGSRIDYNAAKQG
jgi:hypothetical protein